VSDLLRASCPVVHLDTLKERSVGGLVEELGRLRDAHPIFWNENGGYWVLTRASLVREVFQDPVVFTNDSISPGDPDPEYKWIPSNINPPTHVQYRQILNHAFGPAAVRRIEPKAREYSRMAVDDVVDRGECDFIAEVAGLFPTRVFLELVGLPWEDAPQFLHWVEIMFNEFFSSPAALEAAGEVREYFIELIADRRRSPRDPAYDFPTHLLRSTIDGEPISDDDMLNIWGQLVLAGLDTVKSALGYSFLHLATHDDDRRRLAGDFSLIPTAIEEFLRAYPLVLEGRKLGEDVDFHGCPMKKGQMVMLALPAAMRDPEYFERADEVLIDREKNNHMSFGGGPHRCLGSHLARMEMVVGLEEWHRRIPEYRLGGELGEIRERGGQLSLRSLPLVWET